MNKNKVGRLLMLLMSIVMCVNALLLFRGGVFYSLLAIIFTGVLLVLSVLSVIFLACNMKRYSKGLKNSSVVFSSVSIGLIVVYYYIIYPFSEINWYLLICQVVLMIISLVFDGQSKNDNSNEQFSGNEKNVPCDQNNMNIQQDGIASGVADSQNNSTVQSSSTEKTVKKQGQPNADGLVYDLKGVRGRSMKVYEDKAIINTRATFGSLLTGNATDGEKSIYYTDVLGVQFKPAKMMIGYLQLETASSSMNNRGDNFFNENSFTFEPHQVKETTNELMQEVADYIRSRVEFYKKQRNGGATVAALSPAEELKKFKELLDMGVITQEEFDKKKKDLLGL